MARDRAGRGGSCRGAMDLRTGLGLQQPPVFPRQGRARPLQTDQGHSPGSGTNGSRLTAVNSLEELEAHAASSDGAHGLFTGLRPRPRGPVDTGCGGQASTGRLPGVTIHGPGVPVCDRPTGPCPPPAQQSPEPAGLGVDWESDIATGFVSAGSGMRQGKSQGAAAAADVCSRALVSNLHGYDRKGHHDAPAKAVRL